MRSVTLKWNGTGAMTTAKMKFLLAYNMEIVM